MAKVRVPLHGKSQGYAQVETEATKGATLGENLYRQDGSVVTEADLAATAAAADGVAVTIWRLIREIPANIKGLAAVTTNGWFRKDGATIVAREIAGADLPDLADSGTGSLLAITRDAKGRVSGTKAATITGTAGRVTVANGDAAAGLPTIDLATVADAGGGTLLRIVRDAWGRITGTSAATTSDLAEGSNLYHTAQRVRDTILTGLSTATNAVITATDTVLSALGKLQAQISGLIVQTITDGDTTHAPSGDAVFDALALKAPLDSPAFFNFATITSSSTNSTFFALRNTATGGRGWSFFSSGGGPSAAGTYGIFDEFASTARLLIGLSGEVQPGADNVQKLGSAALRWSEVFAGNATINTSDAREKTAPRDLTPVELAAAADIARLPCIYQWLHAIEEKGEAARLHCSPTVQSVIAIMEKHGLDPFRYAFICYDKWDETPEVRDEEGEVTQEYRPAGDRYSLRPSELAHFVMRGQEARIAALEKLTEKLTVQ